MARRSIQWPPQLDGGRLRMTPDPAAEVVDLDQQLRQALRLALQDGRSANPWNQADRLGVDDPAFRLTTQGERARLRAECGRQFRRLERQRRARLVSVTFDDTAGEAGQVLATVTYDNLETGGRVGLELAING